MSTALAIFGVAVVTAVLCASFQSESPAFALLLSLGAALVILARAGTSVQILAEGLAQLERQADGEAFSCLLRCSGIALLTDWAKTLCEEAGAESLAWCAGLAGRCLMLATVWPILQEICQRIGGIAG